MAHRLILSPFPTYSCHVSQALKPHSLLSVHEMWTSEILSSFLEVYPYSGSSSHGLSAHSLKDVFWSPC